MFGKTLNTKTLARITSALLLTMLLISAMPCTVFAGENKDMITSFTELKTAIRAAKDGDTLYVGDIDFTPSGDMFKLIMRIEADKSLTIKSGKSNEKAVFTNGSFILSGSKTDSGRNTFHFENIIFDGGVDTSLLTAADFDCQWSEEEQRYLLEEPRVAQYALLFKGNVDADFIGCDFKNYTHEYGPVMHVRYDDYTAVPSLLEMFGDYSGCTLNLSFSDCNFSGNAAAYDGGAIYMEGNGNVTFTAIDCVFENNYSGDTQFSVGGGAIYAQGAKLAMERCRFENNTANHLFPDSELPDSDTTQGGGMFLYDTEFTLSNSVIVGNTASMGGGIGFRSADGVVDGCVFTGNRAEEHSTNWTGDTGPWNNMAQGGAICHMGATGSKVTVINSSIYGNSAQNAYGGIYSYYAGVTIDEIAAAQLELQFCTYTGNTCDSVYDYDAEDIVPWCSHPGDILEIPYIKTNGCILIDDSFAKDFPHRELPSEDNGYNYIASPGDAETDGLNITHPDSPAHLSFDIPKGMNLTVPTETMQKLIGNRYDGKLKHVRVGDNYDASLYPVQQQSGNVKPALYWIVPAAVVAAAIAVFAAIHYKRRKKSEGNAETEVPVSKIANPAESEAPIVKAWFTKEEIDTIMKSFPKVQTLTGRETEVFIEMLEGKKQKEISYDLGIEITTVKDFYRKIYDKLDLANKDELLKQCSTLISNQ
ncbi:MAG: LuxR C-terminal-related transcriptional regulator [Clostridia bacterium]|nr:LuxR C-terminal-related transcriptional regulator [Clostridia bacterium]